MRETLIILLRQCAFHCDKHYLKQSPSKVHEHGQKHLKNVMNIQKIETNGYKDDMVSDKNGSFLFKTTRIKYLKILLMLLNLATIKIVCKYPIFVKLCIMCIEQCMKPEHW